MILSKCGYFIHHVAVHCPGFSAEPGNWENQEIGILSVQVQKWSGIYRKSEKTRTKQEIYQKIWIKPGMLRYTKFQYYIETILSTFCTPANLERLWCLSFGAKIVHTIT